MDIYNQRNRSAYGNSPTDSSYSENPHILKWWTPLHDDLLLDYIEKYQWIWDFEIVSGILVITPSKTIKSWKSEDPLCSKYVWYNLLMYFAKSRAEKIGLTKHIRKPEWKICPLCNKKFIEDSLPAPLIKRLGINQIDFCAPCLKDTIFRDAGNNSIQKQKVLTYIKDLTSALQRIPSQDFGLGMFDLYSLNTTERLSILKILRNKPTLRRIKKLFGSWLNALIGAGVLEDGTRRTSRGTQCLAKDGHICLSLGEKTIDDLLYSLQVVHDKEPKYPEGNYRADFIVNGIFIEYLGLAGNTDYDAKIKLKEKICDKHGIKLILIYPADLVSSKKLEAILRAGLSLFS